MTSETADPAEAAAIAPAADPGFLQRHGATIEYILIPGAALVAALVVFGMLRRAVRQEPARSLFLHVSRRVRHLVLLAEHADARRAADPDRAVHGAARAARHGDHRRRRRAADRRARRPPRPRSRCRRRRRWSCSWRWLSAGMVGGGLWIMLAGGAAPVPRRQRDHLEPAAGLYRARDPQPSGRGPDARSRQPQQAVDPRDRRRQHDRHDPRHRRALGPGVRHHRRRRRLCPDLSHHVRLRRPRRRRQHPRRQDRRPGRRQADPDRSASWPAPRAGLAGMVEVAAVRAAPTPISRPATASPASWSRSWRGRIRWRSSRWRSCSAASAPAAGCCSAGSACPTPRCRCCRASSSSSCWPATRCMAGSAS